MAKREGWSGGRFQSTPGFESMMGRINSQLSSDMGLFGQLYKNNPAAAASLLQQPFKGGGYARDLAVANQYFGGDFGAYQSWLSNTLTTNPQAGVGGYGAKSMMKSGPTMGVPSSGPALPPGARNPMIGTVPSAGPQPAPGPRNPTVQPPPPNGVPSAPFTPPPPGPRNPTVQPPPPNGVPSAPFTPPPPGPMDGLRGYGLQGFGIPGFETNPMVGGGSWQGVTWNGVPERMGGNPAGPGAPPAPPTGGPPAPPPDPPGAPPGGPGMPPPGDVVPPGGRNPGYEQQSLIKSMVTKEGDGGPGLQIPQAKPYDYSNYTQFYGNHLPPFMNLQQQIEHSMMGIQPAKPTFNWAGPGWGAMLGFQAPQTPRG